MAHIVLHKNQSRLWKKIFVYFFEVFLCQPQSSIPERDPNKTYSFYGSIVSTPQ